MCDRGKVAVVVRISKNISWPLVTVTVQTPQNTRISEARAPDLLKFFKDKEIINPLAPELFFLILAHSVYKMWITQEPNKLALWNKLHFEEKKTESIEHV